MVAGILSLQSSIEESELESLFFDAPVKAVLQSSIEESERGKDAGPPTKSTVTIVHRGIWTDAIRGQIDGGEALQSSIEESEQKEPEEKKVKKKSYNRP